MEHQISINYPEKLAITLKMKNVEFAREIKTISLVKLYELGKISSGLASKILNLSRIDFLELLKIYNVSYFNNNNNNNNTEEELLNDLRNA